MGLLIRFWRGWVSFLRSFSVLGYHTCGGCCLHSYVRTVGSHAHGFDLRYLLEARSAPGLAGAALAAARARRDVVHHRAPSLRALVQAPAPRIRENQTGLH